MSDQINPLDNQGQDSVQSNSEPLNPEQSKKQEQNVQQGQNVQQEQNAQQTQNPYQTNQPRDFEDNNSGLKDGYRHYTYGDSSYRIYWDSNSPNNEMPPNPHRYSADYQTGSKQYNGAGNTADDSGRIRQIVCEEIKKNKPKHRFLKAVALILIGVLLSTGSTYVLWSTGIWGQQQTQADMEVDKKPQADPERVDISIKEDGTVENVVATKSIPSIVGITALVKGQQNPFFFNNEIPQYAEAIGSGVIVDSSGYILTNSHVVSNGDAEKLTVSFSNNEKADAEMIWHDQTLDLAVIKVDKTDLPVIKLGDSDAVQVGDKAIAVGNPLGLDLQSTLTSGYISGLNRTIQVQDGNILDGLIQTDAAINSGNSGGALLNVQGEVIGINTARPQTASGIGFAIPVNVAKPIIKAILENGKFEPVYLGISGINVQVVSLMSNEELPAETGVVVDSVAKNSPAAKAGLKSGDIIFAINDHAVDSMNSLKTQLLDYKSGDKVKIDIYRDDQQKTLELEFSDFSFDAIEG